MVAATTPPDHPSIRFRCPQSTGRTDAFGTDGPLLGADRHIRRTPLGAYRHETDHDTRDGGRVPAVVLLAAPRRMDLKLRSSEPFRVVPPLARGEA